MLTGTKSRAMGIVAIALTTCGCVNLEVDHVKQTAQIDTAPVTDKPSYFLSKTTITVTATITLNDCDGIATAGTLKPHMELAEDTAPIDITEALSVAAASSVDRKAEYVIPLDKTRSWAKQLNLAIARNPDKTLVSFNGTLTDQAGPTILAAVQTAIAIGGAVALPAAAPAIYAADRVADHAVQPNRVGFYFHMDPNGNITKLPGQGNQPTPPPAKPKKPKRHLVSKAQPAAEPEFKKLNFCNVATTGALERIALLEQQITKEQAAAAKGAGKKSSGSGGGTTAPTPDPFVVQAQAAIARIRAENNLTRTFVWTWTPKREELSLSEGDKFALISKDIDIFKSVIAPYWLSADGVTNVEKTAAAARTGRVETAQATAKKLMNPVHVDLMIAPWTIGRTYEQKSLSGEDPVPEPPTMGGIVYREPASATLRVCQGPCGGQVPVADAGTFSPEGVVPSVKATADLDDGLLETTADLTDLKVPVSQFGKVEIVSMHSKLFETSIANITQNLDGSISSVGTQSSNAAAAGFAAATAAANAQSSAVAGRNTAIGADNTAATAKAQYMDTVNKAVADCLTQQATISQQGGKPVGQCQ